MTEENRNMDANNDEVNDTHADDVRPDDGAIDNAEVQAAGTAAAMEDRSDSVGIQSDGDDSAIESKTVVENVSLTGSDDSDDYADDDDDYIDEPDDRKKVKQTGQYIAMPDDRVFMQRLNRRHTRGTVWRSFYFVSIIVAFLSLIALFTNVINQAFGSIAVEYQIEPLTLVEGGDLGAQEPDVLARILVEDEGPSVVVLIRDNFAATPDTFVSDSLSDALPGWTLPEGYEEATVADVRALDRDAQLAVWTELLATNAPRERLLQLVNTEVVGLNVIDSWSLTDAIFNYNPTEEEVLRADRIPDQVAELQAEYNALLTDFQDIGTLERRIRVLNNAAEPDQDLIDEYEGTIAQLSDIQGQIDVLNADLTTINRKITRDVGLNYPNARITRYYSWINGQFITTPTSSTPAQAGIRVALLGSIFMMVIVILTSLPIGVSAAIYLEEYAGDSIFNRIIETNVRNLAGVPSIIYGMLGLAIFVRALGELTSGQIFGDGSANGRTLISAALTLSLLILPIVIISAQEALRSVSNAIREASYGLGATKWQTIWKQILPAALPGILTGTILAISRAIGETAPLIVVGASTLILVDPTSPFSQFTVLPIQIYDWTSRPQDQFRNIVAAAIIVLLVLMLTLNATAIILRNRYSVEE